jgi:UDP-N-acetyl-alpha-D-muramoyl-L-alanyl-L-glutamate epimerase
MVAATQQSPPAFDPGSISTFRFLGRECSAEGRVSLRYGLDDLVFEELIELPLERPLSAEQLARAEGLLSLLHWVAGVSYFKAALPGKLDCASGAPPPAAAALLEALYAEGLGELAYTNRVPVPRPRFERGATGPHDVPTSRQLARVLVPVGGGKDSAVAIELVRRSGLELALFSIGEARPIMQTARVADLPHLIARRRIDPALLALNARGAINGHVPITAIVSCVALLSAALRGYDAVAMANERSASSPNLEWDGIEINHQFSKSLRAERLLSAAVAESGAVVQYFSVLRGASELAIARAFARMDAYHGAFTSCNALFRLDPAARASSWCGDCPKCRFVFLALAPFSSPEHLREVFGADLLEDEAQFEGFALLTATGGHKPFECVGEEQESRAAFRLLAADPRWREHAVVRRISAEVLASSEPADPDGALALSDDHCVPEQLASAVDALLGS